MDAAPFRSLWTHLMRASFTQGWIEVDGVSTRYVHAGASSAAPALIMLHGTAGSWECFAANLQAHARYFNCYALDMVGSGFSGKPDIDYEIPVYSAHVQGFMRAVGLERASFMGVSLGAWVAARLAIDHPEVVDKLILLSTTGLVANVESMNSIRSVRTKAVDDPSWDNIRNIFTNLIYDETNRIPDLVALRQAVYQQPEMKRAMEHVLCLQDPEIRKRNLIPDKEWQSIRAPTLVVAAPDDKEVFYTSALRVAQLIPQARLVEVRQVKHWAQFEQYETFNRLSLEFLRA
jgi:2-hydroxy-6-oxonona-2,4-dienedioate hydrolase